MDCRAKCKSTVYSVIRRLRKSTLCTQHIYMRTHLCRYIHHYGYVHIFTNAMSSIHCEFISHALPAQVTMENPVVINVIFYEQFKVQNPQQIPVTVYDYYNPGTVYGL